jgi:NUMOD3 motif
MIKLHFLYKTTNLVNQKVHYGIHASEDLMFGTKDSRDPHCGTLTEIVNDLKKYGRNAFRVEAIQAFATQEEASRALERYRAQNTYKHANSVHMKDKKHALGKVTTEEARRNHSEANRGEKNGFYDKKHSEETKRELSEFRAQMKWIHNGKEEKQIIKGEIIPEGWVLGRKPRRKAKDVIAAANSQV